jgi:hypothetical protein
MLNQESFKAHAVRRAVCGREAVNASRIAEISWAIPTISPGPGAFFFTLCFRLQPIAQNFSHCTANLLQVRKTLIPSWLQILVGIKLLEEKDLRQIACSRHIHWRAGGLWKVWELPETIRQASGRFKTCGLKRYRRRWREGWAIDLFWENRDHWAPSEEALRSPRK